MRTTSEVKSIFNKAGASFGQPGSVSYQFKHVGRIIAQKESQSFDDIFAIAVDLGAEDVEEVGDEVFVYTSLQDLAKVKDALVAKGVVVSEAELTREPLMTVGVEDQDKLTRIENFISSLEELDDVQKVFTNLE
jgi:transcriptional/translational regulatory protein YebC/TACO1